MKLPHIEFARPRCRFALLPAPAARTRSPFYQGLSCVLAKVPPRYPDCRHCPAASQAEKLQPLQLNKNNSPNTGEAVSRDPRSRRQSRDRARSVRARISTQRCTKTGRAGERGESLRPRVPSPDAGFLAGDVNTVGPLGVLPGCGSSPGPSIALRGSAACRLGQLRVGPFPFPKPALTYTGHFTKPACSALKPEPFQDNLKPSKLPTCLHFANSPFFLLPSDTRWQLPVCLDFRRELNVS